jgi:RNA-directed DNA polymerase
MSTKIDRISELAREDPKRQFFSIAHLITPEALYAAFRGLRKKASAGVDGVTHQKYEKDAARNIQQLHERRPKLETADTAKEDLQHAGFSSTRRDAW